ncbi:MAG: B12-binding domain-containing radical SAM protein [Bacteroidales bacterium]|nr:B12-binding domain-containing radical SAM protein [Bacteroidales bacterium]
MHYPSIEYEYPLFRPPSEANSLIFQITSGCSWNNCAFCEMYTQKKFKIKSFDLIKSEILQFKGYSEKINKIFLADGDAMVLKTDKLLQILELINKTFPNVRRISAYAKPKDLKNKNIDELKSLKNAGLTLVYVGLESGDNELLSIVNKGENFDSSLQGLLKSNQAGIKSSVMILNGLGGLNYWQQHAENSAKLVNLIQPEFLSTLVLSFPFGINHFKQKFNAEYVEMNILQLLEEMQLFLSKTELNQTVFRSDHASNYLVLKGILSKDKQSLLEKLNYTIKNPDKVNLREEWQRGL